MKTPPHHSEDTEVGSVDDSMETLTGADGRSCDPQEVKWGAWIRAGMTAGASIGASAVIGQALVYGWRDLASGEVFWSLLMATVLAVVVCSAMGLLAGLMIGFVDYHLPRCVPRLAAAPVAGSMAGFCVLGVMTKSTAGLVAGTLLGFCAAVWVVKPETTLLDPPLPLRGRWLWLLVTGLLIALGPQLYLAIRLGIIHL